MAKATEWGFLKRKSLNKIAHLVPEHKINAVKKIDWSMQGKVTC